MQDIYLLLSKYYVQLACIMIFYLSMVGVVKFVAIVQQPGCACFIMVWITADYHIFRIPVPQECSLFEGGGGYRITKKKDSCLDKVRAYVSTFVLFFL
jgi:hypothetical protein